MLQKRTKEVPKCVNGISFPGNFSTATTDLVYVGKVVPSTVPGIIASPKIQRIRGNPALQSLLM